MPKAQISDLLALWGRGEISANDLHVVLLTHEDSQLAAKVLALLYQLADGMFTKKEFFNRAFTETEVGFRFNLLEKNESATTVSRFIMRTGSSISEFTVIRNSIVKAV